ncbi:pilus assembly FimT family protein [Brevundimonas sp. VNH65]|uniref:pilus assembly FimT family protein n=1 Tax=Brevundimonas sp. VNH65 TaxID=3400917 RepID=UPI003C0FC774
MPTSPRTAADPAAGRRALEARRAGYSLIEILVVLAIMALAVAVVMPSTSRMMDQTAAHAVFFEFQRGVYDLRREANRTGLPLQLIDPGPGPEAPASSASDAGFARPITTATLTGETSGAADPRRILLRAPWRYTLAPALDIAGGGVCGATTANLVKDDQVVMTLRTSGGDCRFLRQAATDTRPAPAT